MTPTLWLLIYLVLASLVIFLSIKLSKYVDLLDKKTKIAGALLGGILLAGVTSLPELFTSLTGTIIVGKNDLVLGNIMGSDFFDIMIFGVVYFLFFKKFTEGKVGKQHYLSCLFTALMLIAVTIAAFVFSANGWLIGGYFNPMSFVIIAIYVISIIISPKTEEKEENEEVDDSLSVKQIWIRFTLASIVLIAASITVTIVTDKVVGPAPDGFDIGETFGGSLFLGVATSLPEVTATIALCRKKNFDAAYGDIIGSCTFNIIILAIADALSFKAGPLFIIDESSFMLLLGTALSLVLIFVSILYIRSKFFKNDVKSRILIYSISTILISSYLVYLVLSSMKLDFPFI
jgi:cation:H+ antiporter